MWAEGVEARDEQISRFNSSNPTKRPPGLSRREADYPMHPRTSLRTVLPSAWIFELVVGLNSKSPNSKLPTSNFPFGLCTWAFELLSAPPIPVALWAAADSRALGEGKPLTPRRKDAEGKTALEQRLTIGRPGNLGAQPTRRHVLIFLCVLASPRLRVEFQLKRMRVETPRRGFRQCASASTDIAARCSSLRMDF